MSIKSKWEQLFLIALLIIGAYFIILASQTQMLGEDEAIYVLFAKEFLKPNFVQFDVMGKPLVVPVFIPLVYSMAFLVSGPSLAMAKAMTAIFGILTLFMVYLIGRKFSIKFGIIAVLILLSIGSFTHQSLLAYVDIPIAFFAAFFIYLLLDFNSKSSSLYAILIGAVLSLSFYTKLTGLVLILFYVLYAIYTYIFKGRDKNYFRLFLISLATTILLVSPFIIRNIIVFQYPFIPGLNSLFSQPSYFSLITPKWLEGASKLISPTASGISTYISTFGFVGFLTFIFGLAWTIMNFKEKSPEAKLAIITASLSLLFIFIFFVSFITGYSITESRYLSIIIPPVALLGGLFVWQLTEKYKKTIIIVLSGLFIAAFFGLMVAAATSNIQRYSDSYLQALSWIKNNTQSNSLIFTAYGGSLLQFADRNNVWTIEEFPQLMEATNGTYIYDTLKAYNVSYIYIWSGIIAQNYIIPQSNILGVFTVNFYNVVSTDTQRFQQVFSNGDNVIYKLL